MLEIRPICENCARELPNGSDLAMICSFECTFCRDCVENVIFNVCPNCGGGLEPRPTRPAQLLPKYHVKTQPLHVPVDPEKFRDTLAKYRDIDPRKR
jgi:hypothetical protein